MRIIWISAGLLLVVIVAGFVMLEPGASSLLPGAQNSSPQAVVENPFVENPSTDNSADTTINLAALPSSPDASPATDSTSPAIDTPVSEEDSVATAAVNEPVKTPEPAEKAVAVKEQQVVAEKPEKKLGLSMLALEKEKKKNKVAVIVHQNNNHKLSEKEIKALYLDHLTRWRDGSKVMLYNLPLGDKYRDKFSESILKMTALEADEHESKRRQLRIKVNDVEVKAKNVIVSYVEQHPNAVAYVPLNLVREKSNVKVVLTIP